MDAVEPKASEDITLQGDVDVLIAGAGPAGLTLANDLAARGVSVRVIDPLPEAVRESRAHGMLGRTLKALDKLGLADPMRAAAKQPPPVLREYFGRKLVAERDFSTPRGDPYPQALPIFQQRTVRVLETALVARGHRVEWSTELVGFTMNEVGVVAEVVRDGAREEIRAKWIVGCEGGNSTVRQTLTAEFPGETHSVELLYCECDLDWKRSRDIWWTWQGRQGLIGTIYNDFTNKWHIAGIDLRKRDPKSTSSDFERAGELLRHYSGDRSVRLSNPDWVHAGSFASQRVAKQFVSGRAALAGNAAHVFGSVVGYGVHCAIEDALNLGWKLALTVSGAASPSLLESYDIERRAHAQEVVKETRSIERFMALPHSIRNFLWTLLYFVGPYLRSISGSFSRQTEKLITDYRKSPLTQEGSSGVQSARAGLRVPDGACRVGGRPSRLWEIIRGPQADLLLFAGAAPDPQTISMLRAAELSIAPLKEHLRVYFLFASEDHAKDLGLCEHDPKVIIDSLDQLRAAFGVTRPETIYLRPDGYIGLRTQDLCPERLLSYLSRIYRITGSDGLLQRASA
jgi:2-polyprenyl-6-methoxyphenol hydroxylase-like FAD-dependent oxidoreductase